MLAEAQYKLDIRTHTIEGRRNARRLGSFKPQWDVVLAPGRDGLIEEYEITGRLMCQQGYNPIIYERPPKEYNFEILSDHFCDFLTTDLNSYRTCDNLAIVAVSQSAQEVIPVIAKMPEAVQRKELQAFCLVSPVLTEGFAIEPPHAIISRQIRNKLLGMLAKVELFEPWARTQIEIQNEQEPQPSIAFPLWTEIFCRFVSAIGLGHHLVPIEGDEIPFKWVAQATKAVRRMEAEKDLKKIAIPTQVIVGNLDDVTPTWLVKPPATNIRGVKYVEIEGATHSIFTGKDPQVRQQTINHITGFLAEAALG